MGGLDAFLACMQARAMSIPMLALSLDDKAPAVVSCSICSCCSASAPGSGRSCTAYGCCLPAVASNRAAYSRRCNKICVVIKACEGAGLGHAAIELAVMHSGGGQPTLCHMRRLNYRLNQACSDDLATLCSDVCNVTSNRSPCGGLALRCLQDKQDEVRRRQPRDALRPAIATGTCDACP